MGFRERSVLIVLMALALVCSGAQASCARKEAARPRAVSTRAAVIPKSLGNWLIPYSTGEAKVYAKRLNATPPTPLFRAAGELDTGMLLRSLPQARALVYETLNAGRLNLAVFDGETGKQRVLAEDHEAPATVIGDEAVWITELADGRSQLVRQSPSAAKPSVIFTGLGVSCITSPQLGGGILFTAARSDPKVDPVDSDLFYVAPNSSAARKIASAPHEYGFSGARDLGGRVLYGVVELGGEDLGGVRIWSASTGKTQQVAARAAVLDARADGSMLLVEPQPVQPASANSADVEPSRLRFITSGGASTVLDGTYYGEPLARICGDAAVVAHHDGKENRLDAYDLGTGKRKSLHRNRQVKVSEIQVVDDSGLVCVLDRIGTDGLTGDSRLVWMPLDGSAPVELAATESGFIHTGLPAYCKD